MNGRAGAGAVAWVPAAAGWISIWLTVETYAGRFEPQTQQDRLARER